eukprot:2201606-Rhodomonas_salina.1
MRAVSGRSANCMHLPWTTKLDPPRPTGSAPSPRVHCRGGGTRMGQSSLSCLLREGGSPLQARWRQQR